MNAKTAQGGSLDWKGKHNVLTGTVNTVGGVLATSMVGSLLEMPPTWALGGAAVGAVAHSVAAAGRGSTRPGVLARAAGWVAGGGWMVWALETSPWSAVSISSLAVLGVTGGVTASLVRAGAVKREEVKQEVGFARHRARTAGEWEARIQRVCGIKDVQVMGVQKWEQGTGYTLDLNLPQGGHSWKDLARHQAQLAADADLPNGCTVEALPGVSRRAALLRVATRDAWEEVIPYPEDWSPLSILNPIAIGEHRDASVAALELRSDTVILTGQKGGGKTNELQVLNAGLVRCVDNLLWHIDLNGGGMALPWIRPWLTDTTGQVPAPAVDWVASTAGEAKKMTEAALRIAKGRKVEYQQLCEQHGTDKLPVSPEIPQITIVVDECAEITGDGTKYPKLRDDLEEIQRIARAMAVNLVFCGLSATTDVIGSTAVRKQARARISMRVSDAEELNYLFGWNCKADPQDMPYEGCGLYLQDTSGQPKGFKGYRLVGTALAAGARAVAGQRPALDPISTRLAGDDYATRWDRAAHLIAEQPTADRTAAEEVTSTTDTTDHELPPAGPFDLAALEAGAAVFAGHTADRATATDFNPLDPATWPPIDVPGVGTAVAIEPPALLARLLEVFQRSGQERLHTATLAAEIGTTPTTLGKLLPQIGVQALPNAFYIGSDRNRGYARADIETVTERVRSGEVTVPADIAAWAPATPG
ncbi:hypothetical protein [Saccharothrix algeriensis]|uniref:S-DNA-T family DNA segregation ATPase FtsK/SpoIIIE n=2 Tax=Saccharothrix algeriensis TaxID=173560 RepID=A0ABS2SCL1_9PSEU|nr:hypothetical protein [Saccharothrix algeriensis]MBM7813690.1 S-DNA-T family DNA segregation ATPase FtsK/SpoIIIE [Saccharothrix algeriensis]